MKVNKLLFIFLIGVLVVIVGCSEEKVPSASVTVTGDGSFIDCPEDIGAFCAELYQPVCGDDGETYSNDCFACQKVNKYKDGEC